MAEIRFKVVHDYEETKKGLADGRFVVGNRQTGKTTALVDVVAEKHQGQAIIVTLNATLGDCLKNLWRERHPNLPLPRIFGPGRSVAGYGVPVYADLLWHFPSEHRERLEPRLTAAICGE